MPFTSRFVLVHYSEIGLKRKNRRFFENALADNLRLALRDVGVVRVRRIAGRILAELRDERTIDDIAAPLEAIPGVAHFEVARRCDLDLERIRATVLEAIDGVQTESFAIATRRSNKSFPLRSVEVNTELGASVVEKTGWTVDIKHPQLPVYVYILDAEAYVALGRREGIGGLPVGTGGTVACLLSGGIDSPVAAFRLLRRGCRPVFVHFHSAPFTDAASQDKVVDLATRLLRHQREAPLFLVPFAELQRRIVAETKPAFRVILYRRFMVRAAEAIARRAGARALVTGESLGQVASQTLENLATVDAAATMPILRPLIGWDKLEITREAERIGTYDISIEPHDDCCSFLMPSQPATYSTPQELEEAERGFDIDAEVAQLLEKAEEVKVGERRTG